MSRFWVAYNWQREMVNFYESSLHLTIRSAQGDNKEGVRVNSWQTLRFNLVQR